MYLPSVRPIVLILLLGASRLAMAQSNPSEESYHQGLYKEAMAALKSAKDEERFYALDGAAKESLRQGHDADAKSFAEELERLTSKYKGDWNYGNAVQDANLVLGVLALKAGDPEAAKSRLLAAGHSPGSPQMDSFGPNMTLARALLVKGEKTVVLEYFELCRIFWKSEFGNLDKWKKEVAAGRIPEFGANLDY